MNVKDSFTRTREERERERKERLEERKAKLEREQRRRERIASIKSDFFALFKEQNPQRRGKQLEAVLNRFFAEDGILLKEAFTITGDEGEGIIEQIDGVIEIDGEVYLVEMKWWNEPLGPGEVSQHLVRVFNRGQSRGIFISASGYTDAGINICRESTGKIVVVLCKLQEFVTLLERETDLKSFLKEKINASIIHKNPFYEPL